MSSADKMYTSQQDYSFLNFSSQYGTDPFVEAEDSPVSSNADETSFSDLTCEKLNNIFLFADHLIQIMQVNGVNYKIPYIKKASYTAATPCLLDCSVLETFTINLQQLCSSRSVVARETIGLATITE
ncbi:hypothetical protein C0J52_04751 [Blattella germanica]|nr:hypothetical protein C0J52_04751 [Blattella germanica]